MTLTSMKREAVILEHPVDSRIIRREIPWNKVAKGTPWKRIVAVLRNPEFAAVMMFCAIGFLVTVAVLLAFPNIGEMTQSIQQFL